MIEKLKDILNKYFDGRELQVTTMVTNDLERNNLYLVEDLDKKYVLKTYYKESRKISEELALGRLWEVSDLIPKSLISGSLEGMTYILMEFREGAILDKLSGKIEVDNLVSIYYELGQVLKRVHEYGSLEFRGRSGLKSFAHGLEEIEYKLRKFGVYEKFEEVLEVLKKKETREVLEGNSCIIHGDFDSRNFLVEEIGSRYKLSGIIDFEQSRYDNRYFDVLNIYMKDLYLDKRLEVAFFNGYNGADSLETIKNYRYYILFLAIEMCKRSLGHPKTEEYYNEGLKWIELYGKTP